MDRQANIEKSIAYLAADEQVRCRIPSSPGERQRLLRALMNVWEPKELPEEFLAMQDAELQAQVADKGVVTIESLMSNAESSPFLLWQGDITRLLVAAAQLH